MDTFNRSGLGTWPIAPHLGLHGQSELLLNFSWWQVLWLMSRCITLTSVASDGAAPNRDKSTS